MSFAERFEVLTPFEDDGIRAVPVYERDSGRGLVAHLLPLDKRERGDAILDRLPTLPAVERRRVVDYGAIDGTRYVVTEPLPERQNLTQWLAAIPESVVVMERVAPRELSDEEFLSMFETRRPESKPLVRIAVPPGSGKLLAYILPSVLLLLVFALLGLALRWH